MSPVSVRPECMCRGFSLSPMNSFFKTIFWVKLCWIDELCLPEEMCRGFPVYPVQEHLPSNIIHIDSTNPLPQETWVKMQTSCMPFKRLSSEQQYGIHSTNSVWQKTGTNVQRLSCVINKWQHKTIFQVQLYWQDLPPRQPEYICRAFPVCPLEDHLPSKPQVLMQ